LTIPTAAWLSGEGETPSREVANLSAEQRKSQLPPRAEACATGQRLRMKSYQRSATKDEARVGQKGTLSYVWGPVCSRSPMVCDNRHDTAYIFGAICPARGIGAAIITPAANTECINLHLAEISTQIAPGDVAALIWDGAGWHQSGGELDVPDNIACLCRPYSPELNLVENV
jgi:hypothetical protein